MSLSELSTEEVESLLEAHQFYVPAWSYRGNTYPERWISAEDWHVWEETGKEGQNVEDLGHVTLEHQFGGEGMGDDYYIILKIVDGDTTRFFKKNGYHASHDGSYLDGSLDEVKPVVKPVTFYE